MEHKPQHKTYAETGRVAGSPGGSRSEEMTESAAESRREFKAGGFVSSNDRAHASGGRQRGFAKTQKVGCRQP